MADDEDGPLFSTPVKRARLSRSELEVPDLSPVRSSVDDTVLPLDTDVTTVSSDEQDETLFPSFETTESEAVEVVFPSDGDPSVEEIDSMEFASKRNTKSRDQELALVGPLLISCCCKNECTLNLCANDVLNTRKHFNLKSATEKRKWLMDRLRNDSQITGTDVITKFIVAGKELCKETWCKVLSVSVKTVSGLIGQLRKGEVWFVYKFCMWKVLSLCNLRFAFLNMATVAGRGLGQPQKTPMHGWQDTSIWLGTTCHTQTGSTCRAGTLKSSSLRGIGMTSSPKGAKRVTLWH